MGRRWLTARLPWNISRLVLLLIAVEECKLRSSSAPCLVVDAFLQNQNQNKLQYYQPRNTPGERAHHHHHQLWAIREHKSPFSDSLIESLDLAPLLSKVAAHAGTRRGRQALLALVNQDEDSKRSLVKKASSPLSRKQRVAEEQSYNNKGNTKRAEPYRMACAASADDARQEYDLVEQAVLGLQGIHNTTYPPLYSADSGPWDIKTVADTDDDDWLRLPVEEWTLQHILQAEQVIGMLLGVYEWSQREETQMWTPLLSDIANAIDNEALVLAQQDIGGAVEIARVRSVTDPTGRSTFTFRLNESKFRVLQLLREKESDLRERLAEEPHLTPEVEALKEDLEIKEGEIRFGLSQSVYRAFRAIDNGISIVANLDTIFARAAFGELRNGRRPIVRSEGQIDVKQFEHPLLEPEGSKAKHAPAAVPVDLHLSAEVSERALIISGPNGGGKTLAMKSFGVVSVLCKLGIPIPTTATATSTLRTDFFEEILVSVGDQQNVNEGQSTFTAQLNAYSQLIETVCAEADKAEPKSHLILVDELGGGTEANAGGAIAQAVLEKILETNVCRIVVTTHSARLKALSFESDDFGCATVLLQTKMIDCEYQLPAFELQYGVIGESYALGAASRCTPSLPDDVLERASGLMTTANEETGGDTSGDYIRTLTRSLEKQVELTNTARIDAERTARNAIKCQRAMLSLASAYDRHLALLEDRIARCFNKLKDDPDAYELLGETLSELRVVKRKVKSEQDVLRERGLKVLPNSYELTDGESVVIIKAGGEEVASGKVALLDPSDKRVLVLKSDEVAVLPSLSLWEDVLPEDAMPSSIVVFKRHQLAIWDFESMWQDEEDVPKFSSIQDSKRRLNDVLSTLKAEDKVQSRPNNRSNDLSANNTPVKAGAKAENPAFTSARQRKAVKQKQKQGKRKRK